jgi:histidinol-phosphate aminotransferase
MKSTGETEGKSGVSRWARWIRPLVRGLEPYVPGEQPKVRGLVKLNTNENPYPPSPRVLRAVKAAVDGRLRLYPSATAERLRVKLAELHGCQVDQIVVGNGSDELLALAVRTFVEPWEAVGGREGSRRAMVQWFRPSYSLYPVLAASHGAMGREVPLAADFGLPTVGELRRGGHWDFRAALTLVTTPNAPSGRGYGREALEALCGSMRGLVILDEAYVDFAEASSMEWVDRYPHVLVARTFSKAYSLCFQRVGYLVGHPELIGALHKMRDSYSVNGLGQVAAEATLEDLGYYRRNFERVKSTRARLTEALEALGFQVHPSQTNFVLARPPGPASAEDWLARLRERKVLVRWFRAPELREYLRITIGTDQEADVLLRAVRGELRASGKRKGKRKGVEG